MMREMWYTKKYAGIEGDSIYDSFYQGKNAFLNEYTWAEKTSFRRRRTASAISEYGVVPAPTARTTPKRPIWFMPAAFLSCPAATARNMPVNFIETLLEVGNDMAEEGNAEIPEENRKLYEELSKTAGPTACRITVSITATI